MNGSEILNTILQYLNELNEEKIDLAGLSRDLGYDRAQILYDIMNGKTKKISANLASRISNTYPNLNIEWILTGRGEMLKNSTNILTGNNNAVQSNTGSIGGHQVTVSGSDYEKIIDKDKIEIIRSEANKMCLQEVACLKAEISRLEALVISKDEIIKSKDVTIAAKDETIEILKSK